MTPFLHSSLASSSAAASGALFSAIWEGAVLAAAVALVLRVMPRLSAAARSVIWLNVFGLLVLLHVVPAFVPVSAHAGATSSSIHLDLRWSVGIACAWAVLSIWRAVQLCLSGICLRRIARCATPVVLDPSIQDLLESRELAGRRAQLCTSNDVERPGVFGFFRPRILVPPGLLDTLSATELRQVILHETEHLRRADDWTNLLQKLALVLFPLNPALLWVERRLCAERELACDDRVLLASAERKSYALCLTRLAEYSMLNRGISLVLGAFERRPELVRRVHRILARPARAMSSRAALFVSASLVAAALAAAVGLARSPQFVSFAPTLEVQNLPAISARDLARAEFGGTPQLVKAVMPQRPAKSRSIAPSATPAGTPVRPALLHKPHPVLRATSQPAPELAMQTLAPPIEPIPTHQEFVVLTEWSSADAPPQLIIAVAHDARPSHDSRPRYAAVPFANGWLIVQI